MGDFRANTDVMRNGVNAISKGADRIAQIVNRIGSLNGHIGGAYQGQLRDRLGPILSQAVGDGNRLQAQSGQFSASLNSLAGQIDGVMQTQAGIAINFLSITAAAGTALGRLFGRLLGPHTTGTIAALLSWIGIREAPPGTIILPRPSMSPSPQEQLAVRGAALLKQYDGRTYSEGTYNPKDRYSALSVKPPLRNTKDERDPNIYKAVLNQFGVEKNPRYDQRNGNTYCNIYVWDATSAMGAPIPHWVNANGDPVSDGKGSELNANGVVAWLRDHGYQRGWHQVSAADAQAYSNQGKPAVVVWANPNPSLSGHVAMVRPGEYSSTTGPHITQAGATNYNHTTVSNTFGDKKVTYYVHD